MSSSLSKSKTVPVVFDVLGTCFDLSLVAVELQRQFPDKLTQAHATAVTEDWFHSAQRDFTYLSMNNTYTPIVQVLKQSLPRCLAMAGLSSPAQPFDVTPLTSLLPKLSARPSLEACSRLLNTCTEVEFLTMAATNGGAASTRGYFDQGLGEEESQKWQVFSCDEIKVAKPAPEVYETVWKRLGLEKKKNRAGWFVAAHTWDLFAAKRAGFATAWVSYEECEPVAELWGQPDIIGTDLEDVAKQIIAKEKERAKMEFM